MKEKMVRIGDEDIYYLTGDTWGLCPKCRMGVVLFRDGNVYGLRGCLCLKDEIVKIIEEEEKKQPKTDISSMRTYGRWKEGA